MVKKDERPVRPGRPAGDPADVRKPLVIRLTEANREDLRRLAIAAEKSLSTYVFDILRRHLTSKRKELAELEKGPPSSEDTDPK